MIWYLTHDESECESHFRADLSDNTSSNNDFSPHNISAAL